jgi:hypothetical protein
MVQPGSPIDMWIQHKLDGIRRENERRIVERLPEILEETAVKSMVATLTLLNRIGLLRERHVRKPGPKGPRKHTALGRAMIQALYGMKIRGKKIRGHEICQQLQESKIPLPAYSGEVGH